MRILYLIKGEFVRLYKYKVLQVSLAVTVIWMVVAGLLSKEESALIAPFLILSDLTMMTTLLLAASCFFEKQEGTLLTTIITPVKISDILIAKYAVYTLYGMASGILISMILIIVHGIRINVGLLLLYSVLIGVNSNTLGYILITLAKDFNTVLISLMGMVMVLCVPSVFYYMGLMPEWIKYLLFLSPYHTAYLLTTSTITAVSPGDILAASGYLLAETAALIWLGVAKRYRSFVSRG